jgi:hypothetical protein
LLGATIGTRLPTFHAKAADQARVASMPGTTWPVNGYPPDLSWSHIYTPSFDAIYIRFRHVISDSLALAFLIPT